MGLQAVDLSGYTNGEVIYPSNPPHTQRVVADNVTSVDVNAHGLAVPQRGDPVFVNNIIGVCEVNADPDLADEIIPIQTRGIYMFTVTGKGIADANTAVNFGDVVYLDAAVDQINVDSTLGKKFGLVVGNGSDYQGVMVASGGTAKVQVDVGRFGLA
jgi:hypothetical protein